MNLPRCPPYKTSSFLCSFSIGPNNGSFSIAKIWNWEKKEMKVRMTIQMIRFNATPTCFDTSGENSWNGLDNNKLAELLFIVDCNELLKEFPLFIIDEFSCCCEVSVLDVELELVFDELLFVFDAFKFVIFCNCAPGALLCELLFDPILDVDADSLLSALPFCNTFEKYCKLK